MIKRITAVALEMFKMSSDNSALDSDFSDWMDP